MRCSVSLYSYLISTRSQLFVEQPFFFTHYNALDISYLIFRSFRLLLFGIIA